MTEPCSHHDAQVAVRMIDFDDEDVDASCAWCGDGEVSLGLVKSERHEIAFCQDCRDVIRALASDGGNQ